MVSGTPSFFLDSGAAKVSAGVLGTMARGMATRAWGGGAAGAATTAVARSDTSKASCWTLIMTKRIKRWTCAKCDGGAQTRS